MKYLFALMVFTLAFPVQVLAANAAVPRQTVGRVLLQVEQRGEAWYVDPVTETRYYLKNGPAAYQALRTFGLGATFTDLLQIPIGYDERLDTGTDSDGDGLSDRFENAIKTDVFDTDTDSDGYDDGVEIRAGHDPASVLPVVANTSMVKRLKGRILLQVEDAGQAWYINPTDGKRYYMTDGAAAYSIMRFLSLGITDADLAPIPVYAGQQAGQSTIYTCSQFDVDCFLSNVFVGNEVTMSVNDIYQDSYQTIAITTDLVFRQGKEDYLFYAYDFALDVDLVNGEPFDFYEELGVYEEDFPMDIACSIPTTSLSDYEDHFTELVEQWDDEELGPAEKLTVMALMLMLDPSVDCEML